MRVKATLKFIGYVVQLHLDEESKVYPDPLDYDERAESLEHGTPLRVSGHGGGCFQGYQLSKEEQKALPRK